MKNNLLNNQNYILGESEKKKLLTKLFIETSINKFYKILTLINYYVSRYFWVLFFTIIILCSLYYSKFLIFLIFLVPIADAISIDSKRGKRIPKNREIINYRNITKKINFWNYVFNEFDALFNNISNSLITLIKTIFIYVLFYFYFLNHNNNLELYLLIIWSSLSIFLVILILRIKVINLLLVPILLIYESFILLYSFIYIFLFRWINWYIFIKKHFKTNLLKKFYKIDWEVAENRDYIIKIKV